MSQSTTPPAQGSGGYEVEYNYTDSASVFRCFSCSSGWKNCSGETALPYPEIVALVPCPQTHSCFVRQDINGEYHRGCADGFFSNIDILGRKMEYLEGCIWGEQVANYGSFVKAWCFCNTGGCNIESFASLGGDSIERSPLA
ncbi:uncharacterized protein LOC106166082 [Lingula anatina]|uniref:Uncharacterized protein LOC106166082 n=1 Tax=Lingula anatina TaxID=7574 RepID=A0A1S3IPW6_LINAN|nr:uncharacterized protein LOC106166082 [Lingula anatina]|eukprot:XP_013399956.1 uncharacterized protein LOC106166082 [Lingula anatina]